MLCALAAAVVAISPALPSPFGTRVADADLAGSVAFARTVSLLSTQEPLAGTDAPVTGEVIDNWWTDDGMLLIDQAVRSTPQGPASIDFTALMEGDAALRFNVQATAITRP